MPTLTLTQDDAADELLSRDPLALLLGMLFDQHMRQRSSGDEHKDVEPEASQDRMSH